MGLGGLGGERVRIQEYLTAAIQNIQILMKYGTDPRKAVAITRVDGEFREKLRGLINSYKIFLVGSISLWRLIVKPSIV